jgi:hypothetical protein
VEVSHVSDSILTSTKKVLGIAEDYEAFDLDILMHINSVFSILHQLGVGLEDSFMIEDATPTWDDFLDGDDRLNMVKTYVYLRVRLLFDPPTTSYLIESTKKQYEEMEWRLNVVREGDSWVDPDPVLEDSEL